VKIAYREIPIGYELEPVTKLLTPEMSKDFSGWPDWRNFHTDEEIARDFAFPNLLAQGALVACYISKMCTGFFGEHWFTHGELKVQFKKPVFTPQRITAKGKLAERNKEKSGTRITLEVWVENEAGEKVQTGTASCIVL
jgi:acyl dehydratase